MCVVRWALFVVCRLMFAVCCFLADSCFVVCCLLFGGSMLFVCVV